MDMEVSRKDGETHIIDMYRDAYLFEQTSRLKKIKVSSLYLSKNIRGQSLLIVKFDNNTVWMPRWDDEVTFLWCYSFLTEFTNMLLKESNRTKPKKYNPQKNLIEPLLEFINKEIRAWELKLIKSPIKEGVQLVRSQSKT